MMVHDLFSEGRNNHAVSKQQKKIQRWKTETARNTEGGDLDFFLQN